MTTPYTREELNAMDDYVLLERIKNNDPKMYPHCLIGKNIHEARKQISEWTKAKVEILISGKEGCVMDYNTCYFYCDIDKDEIITNIWKSFDE